MDVAKTIGGTLDPDVKFAVVSCLEGTTIVVGNVPIFFARSGFLGMPVFWSEELGDLGCRV